VVEVPWCSIIVPTLSDSPPAIKFLPSPEELERLGIELIVSKDMGWRNASRTRNTGAMKARGKVLCFIDKGFKVTALYPNEQENYWYLLAYRGKMPW
jgi:hypothetical protein